GQSLPSLRVPRSGGKAASGLEVAVGFSSLIVSSVVLLTGIAATPQPRVRAQTRQIHGRIMAILLEATVAQPVGGCHRARTSRPGRRSLVDFGIPKSSALTEGWCHERRSRTDPPTRAVAVGGIVQSIFAGPNGRPIARPGLSRAD